MDARMLDNPATGEGGPADGPPAARGGAWSAQGRAPSCSVESTALRMSGTDGGDELRGLGLPSWARAAARQLARLGLLSVLWLAFALSLAASEPVDWTGEWDTIWRGGGARLILSQEGNRVTGTYPLFDGVIEARSVGRKLEGSWRSSGGEGTFVFVKSREGDSFSGRYASGEWWTGARAITSETDGDLLAQSTPADALGAFLTTKNAVGPGSADLLGRAAALLVPVDEADTGISRIDHTRLLFKVLDRMTVRLWDVPAGADAPDLTVNLAQAGTDVSLALEFRRIGIRWYILPPPAAELHRLRARLDAARLDRLPEAPVPDPARASPRDTMRTLITGLVAAPGDPSHEVISTLNMSEIGAAMHAREGPLLARFLKLTLDRVGFLIWQEVPDDPGADTPYIHFQHPMGDIAVAPVETPEGIVWQFTPETLRNIRRLYAAMDEMPLAPGVAALPVGDAFFRSRALVRQNYPMLLRRVGAMELWQWLGLLAMIVIGGVLGSLLALPLGWLERRAMRQDAEDVTAASPVRVLNGFQMMGVSVAIGSAVLLGDIVLAVPDEVGRFTTAVAWILLILGATIAVGRLVDWVADVRSSSDRIDQHQQTIIDLLRRVIRIVVYLIGAVMAAQVLNIPWQGLVAGISVGGLAVALAVQPALGNLFAGITLYSDRPIKVGDFCKFNETMGTVEQIGLRSTRIRTLDRTLVTIPNAEFSNMQIENFARRDRIWLQTTLQLRYETSEDQLRYVLVELRKLLIAHPRVSADPVRVRFAGFGAHSLDIEIFTYVLTADIGEFQAVREDVYLRIMALVAAAGAQFAFPSAMHYRAEDHRPDAERVQAAEAEVARWRGEDTLPFPDFDWQEKASISGTLDYPPKHSVLANTDPMSR
ncbi:MAG: mechanosensitive ion channel family protein [Chromatiaceae bacterium]|nr:MAG: mechanosensitive ion channel family protein [Chromatiaceae bacterium]